MFKLDDSESFNVTLIDANHCPGAVMYLFEGYFGCVLATGDFRFNRSIIEQSKIVEKDIEICFLDNTYFNPLFSRMPSRESAAEQTVNILKNQLEKETNVIIEFKMKNLGKEELLVSVSKSLGAPVCVSPHRYKMYVSILGLDPKHFTTTFDESTLLFVSDTELNDEAKIILSLKNIKQVIPTALNMISGIQNRAGSLFSIPYSDHSSYDEIVEFVKLVKPKRLIPIVRKELPKNIDTTDISPLDVYLSSKPRVDCHDKYKLLLKSSTLARKSSNLQRYDLRSKRQNNQSKRFITLSVKKPLKKIAYESPMKASQTVNINCSSFYTPKLEWKALSDHTEVLDLSALEKENQANATEVEAEVEPPERVHITQTLEAANDEDELMQSAQHQADAKEEDEATQSAQHQADAKEKDEDELMQSTQHPADEKEDDDVETEEEETMEMVSQKSLLERKVELTHKYNSERDEYGSGALDFLDSRIRKSVSLI